MIVRIPRRRAWHRQYGLQGLELSLTGRRRKQGLPRTDWGQFCSNLTLYALSRQI